MQYVIVVTFMLAKCKMQYINIILAITNYICKTYSVII